jgi:ComF family protein
MQLLSLINNLLTRTLLREQYCVLCNSKTDQQQICKSCYHNLVNTQPRQHNRCWRCLAERSPKQLECQNCIENQFVFDRIIAAFDYGFPIEQILQRLKYSAKLEYSTFLSQLFWSRIGAKISRLPDIIIPVPLHQNKHKLRGFNQTDELIREFCSLNPDVKIVAAKRTKETQQQARLKRIGRIANMANAFEIHENLRGKNIAIIDDVVTTGTTVNELAKMCKKRGANTVEIWCLMRAGH